ncbi:MAG: FHA domain-containing protein [Pseudomonadota bacterium]
MKFIRDIIGEKRQMGSPINGTPAATSVDEILTDASTPKDSAAPEMAQHESDLLIEDQFEAPSGDNTSEHTIDTGVSDEVAAFFAETETHDEVAAGLADYETDNQDPEEWSTSEPSRDEAFTDDAATASDADEAHANTTSENDVSNEIDQSLSDAFRAYEAAPEEDLSTEQASPEAEPSVSAEHQAAEKAYSEPTVETSQSEPELPSDLATPMRATEEPSMTSPEIDSAAEAPQSVEVPQPAVGRGASRHGRVKTRLLGFNTAMETETDPITDNGKASAAPYTSFPVGWLIVIAGDGRGSAFTLFNGVSTIGRGEDQTIRLDFGDNSISRENHASIAYDPQQRNFFIGHGGKANIVRRNDRPVLSTEEMAAGDHITIGETTMRFVPFCCPEFSWEQEKETDQAYAKHG